jgi:RyR domain
MNMMELPDIELVAARVHESWLKSKRTQGVKSRKAEDGEELMVPYEELSEKAKELDRNTVRAVYDAIRTLDTRS